MNTPGLYRRRIGDRGFWLVLVIALCAGGIILAAMKISVEDRPEPTEAEKRAFQRKLEEDYARKPQR